MIIEQPAAASGIGADFDSGQITCHEQDHSGVGNRPERALEASSQIKSPIISSLNPLQAGAGQSLEVGGMQLFQFRGRGWATLSDRFKQPMEHFTENREPPVSCSSRWRVGPSGPEQLRRFGSSQEPSMITPGDAILVVRKPIPRFRPARVQSVDQVEADRASDQPQLSGGRSQEELPTRRFAG
jgi:hypothetical protein